MKFFPFHIGDWLASTRFLSTVEKAIYFDLLIVYYSQEEPISENQMQRICNAYSLDEQSICKSIANQFFTKEGDLYIHHRCDAEIQDFYEARAKRSNAANKRWEKARQMKCNADAMQMQCISNEYATNNQEPINNIEEHLAENPQETPAPAASRTRFVAKCPEGVNPADFDEWMKYRRAKKKPVTQRVLTIIEAEAAKARIPLADAYKLMADKQWLSFKADWTIEQKRQTENRSQMSFGGQLGGAGFDECEF